LSHRFGKESDEFKYIKGESKRTYFDEDKSKTKPGWNAFHTGDGSTEKREGRESAS
jgi:hypothetical protein